MSNQGYPIGLWGQGLVWDQGVSTRRWAMVPHLWGPLMLQDPLLFSLEPLSTQLPCVATRRHSRGLDNGEAVYRQGETYTLGSPVRAGLAGGGS